jgi:two-component system OmpR family response regulator
MVRPDHILIVDDDAEIRSLLREYFQKNGYRVTVAADGRQMRAAVVASRPDLIVLDLMLPGEDGFSLCRGLRALRGSGHHADRARRGNRPHRRPRDGRSTSPRAT